VSAETIDRPGAVRDGEAIDLAAVDAFLKQADPSLHGTPELNQFRGGASNLTYLLAYPDRELVLRRPPFGARARGAHDMLREARVMAALKPVYPLVPAIVAVCDSGDVMDGSFYVMERIRGTILRGDLPPGLNLSAERTRALCFNAIDTLIALHQVDVREAGLETIGKGEGYVRRQIESWSDRYCKALTPDAVAFESVMEWLARNMPARDVAACVIHNDFRFDNVVLDPDDPLAVIGVLDWEMATIGDPLMDLGNSLAYWVEARDEPRFLALRRQPTHLPGMLTRQEVIAYYGERTGYAVRDFDFYLVYGLFRLAVIVQQIYYRFHHGHTRNPEFASYVQIATYLEQRCLGIIEGRERS
jgi:aminoglycoside phosphotransferase (APT) family kinase protein